MILQIAWKNIWRNKKRSLIIITATALGLWGGVFSNAVMIGMWESTIDAAINRELSHIQVHHPKFKDEKLLKDYIPNSDLIFSLIKNENDVKSVSRRVIIEGMILSPTSTSGVEIVGINPIIEKNVTEIHNRILEGSYFKDRRNNSILIGERLAKRLKVKLNSKVVLSFQGLEESLVSAAFRIVGIFKTESTVFDETNVFVLQDDILQLIGNSSVFHEIAIRARSIEKIDTVKSYLSIKFSNLSVESWRELAPEFGLTQDMLYLELNIFIGIILFALLFGITNTIMMSVFERARELGVLLAIGMKRIRLFIMIVIESILLSFTGGAIGTLLAFLTIQIFSFYGLNFSAFTEGFSMYGVPAIFYPELPLHMYIFLGIMITFTAIAAAFYPALKAIKLNPAAAIRTY